MPATDMTRRLPSKVLDKDIDSLHGLRAVKGYVNVRPDASQQSLQEFYDEMIAVQQKETEMEALYKAAMDASRQAEWKFHNSVLSMKESVRAQFGPDSNEAQAIGYKKKSERKRPQRSKAEAS